MNYKFFATLTFAICTTAFSFSQTYNDGPVQLQIKVAHVYAGVYDDLVADAENVWKIWARDDADLDGADWVGGPCIQYAVCTSCAPYTSPYNGTQIFNFTYGQTVPSRFDLYIDAW